jgi:hypothetical protein
MTDDQDNYFNRVEVEDEDINIDKQIDSLFSSDTSSEASMVPLRQGNSTTSTEGTTTCIRDEVSTSTSSIWS